jgi:hypothetical protein
VGFFAVSLVPEAHQDNSLGCKAAARPRIIFKRRMSAEGAMEKLVTGVGLRDTCEDKPSRFQR